MNIVMHGDCKIGGYLVEYTQQMFVEQRKMGRAILFSHEVSPLYLPLSSLRSCCRFYFPNSSPALSGRKAERLLLLLLLLSVQIGEKEEEEEEDTTRLVKVSAKNTKTREWIGSDDLVTCLGLGEISGNNVLALFFSRSYKQRQLEGFFFEE